ncbi:hypothetical protein COCON_G00079820 [Conger conger]|uniref:Nedd4 family interacting protein 1 n=1 Tax=Conger conger TaxID=82655 RepID=A0A9Q1I2K9_CONCO|nr:hypothetical protein COCON_G00079820 [Conger conger]
MYLDVHLQSIGLSCGGSRVQSCFGFTITQKARPGEGREENIVPKSKDKTVLDFGYEGKSLINYIYGFFGRGLKVLVAHIIMAEQSSRYQQLPNEEEPGEGEQAAADAPPPYSSIAADNAAYFDYKEDGGFPKPPSYNVATSLPSYDEAERSKAEATIPLVAGRDDDFVARDDFEDADQLRIGNDGIFMLTFFMAFLFNWIGFFLSFCLTTSAAGRYGAISGFGLSLIKWILIVRFSTYFPGYFDGQYWLWWVFLVLGFLLFLRGFINYAKSPLHLLKLFSFTFLNK